MRRPLIWALSCDLESNGPQWSLGGSGPRRREPLLPSFLP